MKTTGLSLIAAALVGTIAFAAPASADRVVVRHTEVVRHDGPHWNHHHRVCRTVWHHHHRVTRCG